jgi:hypothetical protein
MYYCRGTVAEPIILAVRQFKPAGGKSSSEHNAWLIRQSAQLCPPGIPTALGESLDRYMRTLVADSDCCGSSVDSLFLTKPLMIFVDQAHYGIGVPFQLIATTVYKDNFERLLAEAMRDAGILSPSLSTAQFSD